MELRSLPDAVAGTLELRAALRACFEGKDITVRLRWDEGQGELESDVPLPSERGEPSTMLVRKRQLCSAEVRSWVKRIAEAAEREEMTLQDTSTTYRSVALTWQGRDAVGRGGGQVRFSSRAMIYGAEGEAFVRELMARGRLPEKARAMVEEGFAKGFFIRALALFDLAEEIAASLPGK